MTKDTMATCPILERILNSTPPGTSPSLVKKFQTSIMQNMMDYLTAGSEDILVLFHEGPLAVNIERSLCGLSVFCNRIVDKVSGWVWQQQQQQLMSLVDKVTAITTTTTTYNIMYLSNNTW